MSATDGSQSQAVFDLLQDPRTYGRTEPVTRIDTHGAAVFLAGPDVYKVKRAVRFPFMDFSTLAKRRAACEAEITVNRANAPGIYLGVVPITREGGGLRLGGDGEVVEWAVHLRRFDETATLDRLAAKGPLGRGADRRPGLGRGRLPRRAPRRDGAAATRTLRRLLVETADALVEAGALFDAEAAAAYGAALVARFDHAEPLLLARAARGQVRRCHGDLHLGNLALIDGAPVLFDAIEFDEAIATCDVLYDLAFLVMDLCERGLAADANRLLNRYLGVAENADLQIEGLAALPLFLALRAAIRAKVLVAQLRQAGALPDQGVRRAPISPRPSASWRRRRRYWSPSAGCRGPARPRWRPGWRRCWGPRPGALHLRSDVERKRLSGVAETERLDARAYQPAAAQAVYARLASLAELGLRAGQAVIVDATHQRPETRAAVAAVAARTKTRFVGLWLDVPLELRARRVADRRGDASDADAAVVAAQAGEDVGAIDWPRLDAARPLEVLVEAAMALLVRTGA